MALGDSPISADLAELIAARFSALGDPMRVRILDLLRRVGEASVGEVAGQVQAGYANVAKHLSLMHRERIVDREKRGTRTIYRICDPGVLRLCAEVCGAIERQQAELAALLSGPRPSPVTAAGANEKENQ